MGTTTNIQAWSTAADTTNGSADAGINFVENQTAGSVNNSARALMAAVARYADDTGGATAGGGTANAHTITTKQSLSSAHLAYGLELTWYSPATNTSATVTVAVDGLTAVPLKRADGSALTIGCLPTNMLISAKYNAGTSEFWVENLPPLTQSPAEVFLASGTVSAAATLDIVLTAYSQYRGVKIVLSGFQPATDAVSLWMRFSTDGGSNYDAGASDYRWSVVGMGGTGFAFEADAADSEISLTESLTVGNASTEAVDMTVTIMNHTSTAIYTKALASVVHSRPDGGLTGLQSAGMRLTAQNTDAVRFLFSSGNIAAGNYAVYGMA